MPGSKEREIISTWEANAEAWTDAIQQGKIASRILVTNQAIVEAVTNYHPARALDLGCGEGWLARRLAAFGIAVTGLDAIPALIESARRQGGGKFEVCSYEEIVQGRLGATGKFDAVICNFSLLGYESVNNLVAHIPALLQAGGRFFVQTLHPVVAHGDQPYREGWRPGSWEGFGPEFRQPAPWYFRTVAAWVNLFSRSGLQLRECLEPEHPATGMPASLILICQAQR